ncbi:MAG: azurin [Candidatus Dactylopiibacterium carminicum]|uniref:Azurin n=1 Tax=Candidatus Dactylopiibacterium carminicum TaxID=857335 RepID=A0A272ES51_9RHOO|nr:azurin [Candidatus Dactylopiibacterium carminicum]KAF7598948.1 azurin [Candidatus Dactylopiibacterium carminicum]PAS92866.1 MAG: azurin [Candidatus Dactylopiibacterium carminicum]PAS96371.1 MAG: azurin [Candidatus Dactylopiibacterium carminicum]PAS98966.1 MAG: azurin [Candidatus Dactylopiibacterium carminicum]
MKMLKKTVALLCFCAAGPLLAAPCEAEIEGNDAMQFNLKTMSVPASCKQFTVKLKHVGKLPKTAMGHNWVLVKTADLDGVDKDGIMAGPANNYIKPGDTRVIAHTKLIGGGESDSLKFDVAKLKASESYTFFCSFPGHVAIMKGTLTLTK